MGNSLEQALKRCDFGGCVRSPFLRRSTSFRAVGRFIGAMEKVVYQGQWMCWVDGEFCVAFLQN